MEVTLLRGFKRAACLLALLLFSGLPPAADAQVAASNLIDFVYFGSPECPYCRQWEAVDLHQLQRSALFRHVRFNKITKSIGFPVPPAASFPEAIKSLRDPIAERIQGAGSPMFAIVAGGQVVEGWRGSKKYSPGQILQIIQRQQAQMTADAIQGPIINAVVGRTKHTTALAPGAATAAN